MCSEIGKLYMYTYMYVQKSNNNYRYFIRVVEVGDPTVIYTWKVTYRLYIYIKVMQCLCLSFTSVYYHTS